jgi:hypothetical protein
MISIQRVGTRVETRDARLVKPNPRMTRSKVAKPLLTSLAVATLLAGAAFATVAASSTGSLKPWDWSHASWPVAAARYQACTQQKAGLDVFGCMLTAGARPAAAADAPAAASAHRGAPPTSVVTIHDPAPAGPAAPPGSTRSASPVTGSPNGAGTHAVVNPPANPPKAQPSPQPTSGDDRGGGGGGGDD